MTDGDVAFTAKASNELTILRTRHADKYRGKKADKKCGRLQIFIAILHCHNHVISHDFLHCSLV